MKELVLQDGPLADHPLLDLLLLACRSQAPTILELSRGASVRRFWFRDGAVAAFTTSDPREDLSAFLLRRKKLDGPKAAAVQNLAERDQITQAQVILRDRLLPTPELVAELSGWATLLLVQSFAWTDGTFRLVADSPHVAPPETLLELNLALAMAQGVYKRMPDASVRELVSPFLGFRCEAGVDPAFKITAFRLTPERLVFWEELRAASSVKEAVRASALPEEDALRIVFLLSRTGLLDLVPGEQPAADDADDLDGWLDGLDDLPEPPRAESPSMQMRPTPRPVAPTSEASLGVDMSSIGFRRGAGGSAQSSATYHVASGLREELGTGGHRALDDDEVAEPRPTPRPAATAGLAGLFDGLGAARTTPTGPRTVAPPRGGSRAGWKPGSFASAAPSEPAPPPPPVLSAPPPPRTAKPSASPDALPAGPGPAIEPSEWERMTTTEKDRVRGLRQMLIEFRGRNYFEYFELSHEAAPALVKKAYFKMARRFHPDALVDEGEVYRRLAEAVFTEISEAYAVLSDDEARDKYTRKHIHGEKDENELAMERVQQILAAEGFYRSGVRLLNQGKLGKAVEELTRAVEGYDEEPEYKGWLGYALFRANQHADYEAALAGEQLLKEAIAAKPLVAALPHLMGKIAMQRKDWTNAKVWLRKTLKMNADNPEAVREYKRIDDLMKGDGKSAEDAPGGLKGLFGMFGKK